MITVEDVAKVLAWADGGTPAEVAAAPKSILYLDAAQQCLEDKVVGNFETYGPYHEGRSDMKDMALSAIDALKEKQ